MGKSAYPLTEPPTEKERKNLDALLSSVRPLYSHQRTRPGDYAAMVKVCPKLP